MRVEFRKDLIAADLPATSEMLNLSFKVNYVQSDGSDENITVDNNGKWPKVISGDLQTVGSQVAIGNEHFYIISNTDGEIVMLAKYNLYVGGLYDGSNWIVYGEEATGVQDSTMLAYVSGQTVRNGTTEFSSTNYWSSIVSTYPAYVYDSNSNIYNYVENYKTYLESQGVEIEEARLIKMEELEVLGCSGSSNSCISAPEWVYGTSYWSGSANDSNYVWRVNSVGDFRTYYYSYSYGDGVRPVIVLKS